MNKQVTPESGVRSHFSNNVAVAGPVRPGKPRVLVIEDTADIRNLLIALLENRYDVIAAASGKAGLQMARSDKRPEIILLDVMMPDMDGYEVMRSLGSDPLTANIPVIFLTALCSVEEEQRGLDLGATDYITKPISPPILLARVRLHLERSAYAQRLKDLSEQLSRYLAPQVYQSLFDGTRQAEIQTQRKRLTVFFSDIKNFTASTVQRQPEEIKLLLNNYFAEMSQIAAEYGATLDKFIGDAIVIFFGDPHTLGIRQDAAQCVNMAVAMQKRMGELQAHWRSMGIDKAFEIRIGINSGFCDVGNFGSPLRMEYTIIGREVNLAARLEQAAEAGEILISSETYALVQGSIQADAREPILVKGFAQPIGNYAVRQSGVAPAAAAGILQGERMHERRKTLDLATTLGADTSTRRVKRAATSAPEAEDPEQDVALPDHLEGLDIALGLARAMGMKAFYVSMLRHYLESHNGTPARVREALQAGDLGLAELLSHSLRGISGQIGATHVPSDAAALEQAIHEKQSHQVTDGLLGRLEVSVAELMAALHTAFPPVAAAQS